MSDHAISNAKGWLSEIVELTTTLACFHNAEDYDSADEVRERIQEGPLSLQVRSGWHMPGETDVEAAEFELLLSTGGPALRIIGKLDSGSPYGAPSLQWQDWGTPWTDYRDTTDAEDGALEAYVACFYFGE